MELDLNVLIGLISIFNPELAPSIIDLGCQFVLIALRSTESFFVNNPLVLKNIVSIILVYLVYLFINFSQK